MPVYTNDKVFVLETANTHYVIAIDRFGNPVNLHWGDRCAIEDYELFDFGDESSHSSRQDRLRQEYTAFGGTVYRPCAIKAEMEDGCRELKLVYHDYELDGSRLSIRLADEFYPFELCLNYEIFEELDIIKRSVTVFNSGDSDIIINDFMSCELALPDVKPYRVMNTNGAWGAEGAPVDTLLDGGSLIFESRRGNSGHNASPYFVAYNNADEKSGKVYYANLMWSGSFRVELNRDLFGTTRAMLGVNPFDFEYVLRGGEEFTSPEVICGVADGFGGMTRRLNRFGVSFVLPRSFADTTLPVLYNSWEATYFDVSTEGQTELAKRAAAAGCELFVMDDGWFGKRNDDFAGLGDWFVNKEKFPNGLGELIENVNNLGMDFGIWVEPEMVNPDSDLYRSHPDWAYHYDTRQSSELRHQLVLNMTKPEVQSYIFTCLDDLLSEYNIKYIKWDMNRPFSETGAENLDCPKSLWYLHTTAVYDIVDRLKANHPDVQFESCSSGGGRCDWGALAHFDEVWPSDNTDAIDRLVIQKSYALTRPVKTMRAWVTDLNWYNRAVPLGFKFHVAMRGVLSLGGNLMKYSPEEIEECAKLVELYKSIRDTVQFGDLYRLLDLDRDEISADLYMNEDKSDGVLFVAAVNTRCFKKTVQLHFDGLDDDRVYTFDLDSHHYEKTGAYLKNVGVPLTVRRQYHHEIIKIESI